VGIRQHDRWTFNAQHAIGSLDLNISQVLANMTIVGGGQTSAPWWGKVPIVYQYSRHRNRFMIDRLNEALAW